MCICCQRCYSFAINYFSPTVYPFSVLRERKRLRRQVKSSLSFRPRCATKGRAQKREAEEKKEEEENGEGERTRHTLP